MRPREIGFFLWWHCQNLLDDPRMFLIFARNNKYSLDDLYYSNFDKHNYIDYNWVPCIEPSSLSLGNFRFFSFISTKFAVIISIASSCRFKCKSHTRSSCPVYVRWSENAKYCFYRKVHNFQMVITVSKTSHINYKLISTQY